MKPSSISVCFLHPFVYSLYPNKASGWARELGAFNSPPGATSPPSGPARIKLSATAAMTGKSTLRMVAKIQALLA